MPLAITYAYWQITASQEGVNEITSACLDISISEEANDINLQSQYPISDAEGAELIPYTFTVTNNCNTEIDYQIALEATGESTTALKSSSIKVMLDDNTTLLNSNDTLTPTVNGAYAAYKLGTGTLAATGSDNSSATHTLRLWIDEAAPVSEVNKTFTSKISVTVGQGIEAEPPLEKLAQNIISLAQANNYYYTTTPDYSVATSDGEYGLYKAEDDYGDSYYFRGDVKNNYVQFGSYAAGTAVGGTTFNEETPMYWRIVRINGDGTIRMIYDGIGLIENGEFRDTNDFLYSSTPDSDNYSESNIKSDVDWWYEQYLKDNYSSYIVDRIFCNSTDIFDYDMKNVTLVCSDDYENTVSNNKLTYPIGLITADEAAMAGSIVGASNTTHYLYTGFEYFTLTTETAGYHWYVTGDGQLYSDNTDKISYYLNPVINLKADVEFEYSETSDGLGVYTILTD